MPATGNYRQEAPFSVSRGLRVTLGVAVLMLAPLSLCVAQGGDRPMVGSSTEVRNQASAVYAQNTRPLSPGATVMIQDTLKTGAQSRLKVRLLDQSSLTLGEQAELLIDSFVYDPGTSRQAGLNLLKGALRYIGGHFSAEPKAVEIKTPVAVLGVRGTDFWAGPIDGATGVLVLQGRVDVHSRFGLVTLRPGEGTMIQANGQLSYPKVWGKEKQQRALDRVRF